MAKDLFNDRISRFSIRKLNVGVCSILLGTLVMVGTTTSVAAEENTITTNERVASATTVVEATATSAASTTRMTSTATTTDEVNPTDTPTTTSISVANSTSAAVAVASTETTTSTATSMLGFEVASPVDKETEKSSTTTEKKEETLSVTQGATDDNNTPSTDGTRGRRRIRRAVGDVNDENLIGDDVEDATSTPKMDKPGFTTDIKATDLASQISWLDFGDTANWTGTTTTANGNLVLQVGSTYTKEIMPGYVVTIKVKSLKPFQATELYRKRMEERGATEEEKATYDPNAKNGYVGTTSNPLTKKAYEAGEEAKVIADAQNGWTEIRKEGINTGTKKTTIGSELDGGNIGVQFEISATFRGKIIKPAIVMADGESANPGELVLFTTNGEGWTQLGEWYKNNDKNTKSFIPQDTNHLFDPANGYSRSKFVDVDGLKITGLNLQTLRDGAAQVGPDKKSVVWKYFGSADLTTGGLGTGVFGPNYSSSKVAVPLVMTRNATEIGMYIASSGKQSAMLGFFPLDEGDAPESYGLATHSLSTIDGITGAKINQPYLGDVSPDMDENLKHDWFGDDDSITADEGINQILPTELKGATNDMIKLDRTRPGNYKVTVQAHTDGAPQAYIYGWIDFNQNGTFDEEERSELAKITQDGNVELTFKNSKTIVDPSVN